jgi:hypothetical protein
VTAKGCRVPLGMEAALSDVKCNYSTANAQRCCPSVLEIPQAPNMHLTSQCRAIITIDDLEHEFLR